MTQWKKHSLPTVWSGLESWTICHTWVEFVFSSSLASRVFSVFSVFSGFPPSTRSKTVLNSNSIGNQWTKSLFVGCATDNYCLLLLFTLLFDLCFIHNKQALNHKMKLLFSGASWHWILRQHVNLIQFPIARQTNQSINCPSQLEHDVKK